MSIAEHQDIPFKLSDIIPLEKNNTKMGTFQRKFKFRTVLTGGGGGGGNVGVSAAGQSEFLEDSIPVRNIGCLIICLGEVWK